SSEAILHLRHAPPAARRPPRPRPCRRGGRRAGRARDRRPRRQPDRRLRRGAGGGVAGAPPDPAARRGVRVPGRERRRDGGHDGRRPAPGGLAPPAPPGDRDRRAGGERRAPRPAARRDAGEPAGDRRAAARRRGPRPARRNPHPAELRGRLHAALPGRLPRRRPGDRRPGDPVPPRRRRGRRGAQPGGRDPPERRGTPRDGGASLAVPAAPPPEVTAEATAGGSPVDAPAFWEALYARGADRWELGRPAPPLVAYFATHPRPPGRDVLVPGCGRGHDARFLAGRGYRVRGVDFAGSAIREARRLAGAPAGVELAFEQRDVFGLAADARAAFDGVWEYTSLCAIDPARRAEYVRLLRAVLRDGGW